MQNIVDARAPWTYEFMTHTEVSEDCLYVNVWTAAKSASEKLPVFVFIHGGGGTEGSGAVPVYDGEGLAKKGLVVVNLNYRLGILASSGHPELAQEPGYVTSNFAQLDQIAALKWVQANISNFGGDPNCVTIAGQSAGASAVHGLIASPLAKGLFHRAIASSGGGTVGGRGGAAPAAGRGVAQDAGRGATTRSLAELRALPYEQLQSAGATRGGGGGGRGNAGATPYQNDVPIITGMNTGELGGLTPTGPINLETFRSQARQQYGDQADKFLTLYPASNDAEANDARNQSNRDRTIVSIYLWARQRSATFKTKSFQYLFDHALPGADSARFGAFHTGEMPYVMNTLYVCPRPLTGADREVAELMSSYWANFAKTGDPSGKGLPVWPAFSDGKRQVMEAGDKTQPVGASTEARGAFFEAWLTRQ
jgi:para-nitrobenzyl esterase